MLVYAACRPRLQTTRKDPRAQEPESSHYRAGQWLHFLTPSVISLPGTPHFGQNILCRPTPLVDYTSAYYLHRSLLHDYNDPSSSAKISLDIISKPCAHNTARGHHTVKGKSTVTLRLCRPSAMYSCSPYPPSGHSASLNP